MKSDGGRKRDGEKSKGLDIRERRNGERREGDMDGRKLKG